MGIYDSRKSCWQRRRDRQAQDHAGKGVLGEVVGDDKVVKKPLKEEPEVEEVEEVEEEEKPKKSYKKAPKKASKKSEEKD